MEIKNQDSKTLIENFRGLVRQERKLTAEIVEYIKEIDQRQLFLELGFPNLFEYLTRGEGYTAGAAQRRIDSARILREIPELKKDIQEGTVNIMQLAMVAKCIRAKEKQSVVEVSTEDKKEMIALIQNQSVAESEKRIVQHLDLEVIEQSKIKYQSNESVRLEATLSKKEFEDFRRVSELLSNTIFNAGPREIVAFLCQEFLKRKDPRIIEERVQAQAFFKKNNLKQTRRKRLLKQEE